MTGDPPTKFTVRRASRSSHSNIQLPTFYYTDDFPILKVNITTFFSLSQRTLFGYSVPPQFCSSVSVDNDTQLNKLMKAAWIFANHLIILIVSLVEQYIFFQLTVVEELQ